MLQLIIVLLILSFGVFFIPQKLKKHTAILLALVQTGAFIFFIKEVNLFPGQKVIQSTHEWIPQLGLHFEFILDGLSMVFALLVTGIGALVFLFAHAYMKSYSGTTKFFFFLMFFSVAMLGLVLSANLIQLFIFWELTSVLSFFLISFFHEKESARKAALQSFYITGFGGLCLLAGIITLGSIVDSYSFNDWLNNAEAIKESSLYLPGLLLILTGVFTKSAQFPFHFWLPGAMQAPAPVSAYLHSATMVKAGVFLLARLFPVLGGTPEWYFIIPFAGVLTMITGSYFALTSTDIKGILAYTTINALGVLVLLLGIGTSESIKAALLFLFIHAFYKATLFMVAGLIEKKTGTREISELGGLIKFMPITYVVAILSLLSMAGLPPLLGFLGKELIYEAQVQSPGMGSLILILGVTSNIFMIAISLFFGRRVFLGKHKIWVNKPDEKGWAFLIGPGILALLSLVIGLFPSIMGKALIEPAMSAVYLKDVDVKLKLWHGFNQIFFLSLFTIIAGLSLYITMLKKKNLLNKWRHINSFIFRVSFERVFAWFLEKFVVVATTKTKVVQHGYHRYYILTIIAFTSILLWVQYFYTETIRFGTDFTLRPFYVSGLAIVIIAVSIASAILRSRIVTIITMGVAGYGIALIFLYYSAIDLAITQILVETLTLVMFMAILQRLPKFAVLSRRRTRIRDFLIALCFGTVMTLLTIKAINVNLSRPISDYFLQNSYTQAFGKNVVNVILVDFRAFDTMGEVTVLVLAAIGVYLLLKPEKKKV